MFINIARIAVCIAELEEFAPDFYLGGKVGTRERLLENGAALFAVKGFHGVGVEELGLSVGLTGPSIYRHFRTKGALLAEMLISASSSLLEPRTRRVHVRIDRRHGRR